MGTLGHRALLQYIESNDLSGFKTFLDTRHLPVDDRDEVSAFFLIFRTKIFCVCACSCLLIFFVSYSIL